DHQGVLVLRNEDLDKGRCKPEFVAAMFEDLKWCGLEWQEGPDCGGPFAPYSQSEHLGLYRAAFEKLKRNGIVYPCTCSRQDVVRALSAPHTGEDEPIYPGTCRPTRDSRPQEIHTSKLATCNLQPATRKINWRFRIPDGEVISFTDGFYGAQQFIAGK